MASTKKTSKKKSKKTSKKKSNRKPSPKKGLTEEELITEQLRHQVINTTSEIVQGVESGKILGIVVIGITDNPNDDLLKMSGILPPRRVDYFISLARRITIDNAIRSMKKE